MYILVNEHQTGLHIHICFRYFIDLIGGAPSNEANKQKVEIFCLLIVRADQAIKLISCYFI